MSSFAYKNRYYTWNNSLTAGKDWAQKKSKEIKIKIVSRSQK